MRHRSRQSDALLLPARKLTRRFLKMFHQPESVRYFPRPLQRITFGPPVNLHERQRNILDRFQMRKQIEGLEKKAISHPEPPERFLVNRHGIAIENNLPRTRWLQSPEKSKQGRFTTSRRPYQCDNLIRVTKGCRDRINRKTRSITLAQLSDLNAHNENDFRDND